MKGIPEELLYVLMFLAVVLFQYLMKRFGPQAPEEPAWDERLLQTSDAATDTAVTAAATAAAAAFGVSGAATGHSARNDAPRAAPARRRFSRNSLMGDRRAVQNAVVVATLLGPCRAFEPHTISGITDPRMESRRRQDGDGR